MKRRKHIIFKSPDNVPNSSFIENLFKRNRFNPKFNIGNYLYTYNIPYSGSGNITWTVPGTYGTSYPYNNITYGQYYTSPTITCTSATDQQQKLPKEMCW